MFPAPRKPLVDYSLVVSRPADPASRRGADHSTSSQPSASALAVPPAKLSSQMEAVVRLMAGKEERTIAEKLADSNRPTWEQYKKDNEDKLNLDGLDQRKMEEYRRELDVEREKILSRGINHAARKKKRKLYPSSSETSDADDNSSVNEGRRRSKKRHKQKKKSKPKRKRRDPPDSQSASAERRKKKKKKKSSKRRDNDHSKEDSDGSHYRLSKFFTAASDDDE